MDDNKIKKHRFEWIKKIDQETIGKCLMWLSFIIFAGLLVYSVLKTTLVGGIVLLCIILFVTGMVLYLTSW